MTRDLPCLPCLPQPAVAPPLLIRIFSLPCILRCRGAAVLIRVRGALSGFLGALLSGFLLLLFFFFLFVSRGSRPRPALPLK